MQATLADSPSRSACWAALNERDKMEQYMTEARMLAAQCFCDEDTSGIEMDARLAEAVARKFAPILADAARYRWLRDNKNAYPLFFIAQRDPNNIVVQFTGELVDMNIDAMMMPNDPNSGAGAAFRDGPLE